MSSVQVTITQLPTAGPITGTESVPIVQNGQTVQTTTAAIAASPSQTQTFLTLNQEPTLPNSRRLSGGTGIGLTDGGAQSTLQIVLNGTSGSLESAGDGFIVKTAANTVAARLIEVSGDGLDITNGNGIAGNPTIVLDGLPASLAGMSGSGLVTVLSGATLTPRSIAGTANEIDVANGNAFAGNPTIGLADNAVLPGTGSVTIPIGTTAQEPSGSIGQLRYDSTADAFYGFSNGAWRQFSTAGGVTEVGTGTGLTGGPITSTGTISIDDTVVATLSGSQTLTNKTISGSSNTLSNIANASLTNSAITIGSTAVSLGDTISSFAGVTLSGSTNTVTNIGNASLTNSSVTYNGTTVSLGGTGTITAVNPYALSIGTGLSGTSYDGASAVTIAIASTGVTAASYGGASKTLTATANAQGQLTALAETPIAISYTQVSGLGTAATKDSGSANGVASLDSGGQVPLSQLPTAIQGALNYQGSWNASTNTPTLASGVGTKGYFYIVSVAGTTNLDGTTDWQVGDWAVFNGTIWQKIDNTESVTSVNTYTGAVVLNYADVGAPSTSGTNATGTWAIDISGNAATVTNGVYTSGSYSDPTWLTSLATSKLSGTVAVANGGTGLASYSVGDVLWASGATTISGLGIGSNTYIMTSSGAAPQWSAPSGITVGNATNAANVAVAATSTNANYYLGFVATTTGNNAVEVDADLSYNPSTNTLTTGTVTATSGIFGGTF